MAKAVGISISSVQRIWQAHGLHPHRVRRFKLSKDPEFVPKLREIVGLYVNPPEHAIVLSVDEKSQIQALDRTQPGLPMKKGRAGTLTHDYKRHGTTTLFAALDVLEGKVIGRCMQRHRTRAPFQRARVPFNDESLTGAVEAWHPPVSVTRPAQTRYCLGGVSMAVPFATSLPVDIEDGSWGERDECSSGLAGLVPTTRRITFGAVSS